MPTTMTLLQLRDAAKDRADMVNSTFITDATWNQYLQQSAYELYDILIQKYGDTYFVRTPPYTFTTDGINELFALPSDFYKLIGLDLALPGVPARWVTIRPFQMAERNRNWGLLPIPAYGWTTLRYRLHGDSLWFTPVPQSGLSFRMWYIPRSAEMASDTSTLDGVSGWTEYVIVDAAIKALVKEESDPSALMAAKAGLLERIEAAAENRDAGAGQRVQDVLSLQDMPGIGSTDGQGWY